MAKKKLHRTKIRNSAKIAANKRNKIPQTVNGDASSEEMEVAVVPSSSVESVDEEVGESSVAEDDRVERRSSSDEEEEVREKKLRKRGKKVDVKSKGKKTSKKEEEEEDLEAEEKSENAMYTFPMRRISRIIKSETPDVKISQEAVFVINKASEKFLQLFCKEAYACTFLDKKKQTAYSHLSSVVSSRKRFEFLSDFVPEKVKAGDALAQVAEDALAQVAEDALAQVAEDALALVSEAEK